jgi:phosphate transport system substrate-binding protein
MLRALVGAATLAAAFATPALAVDITGAGATFPYPIYAKWADAYRKETGVGLNYQSIGSGGGIKQITAKTVDFGASDMPLKPEELDKRGLVQFPTVIGGDVPVVNIKGVASEQLRLTGEVLGEIYLGKVKKWNEPAIANLNPGVQLPATAISVVHRSDGSGTTFIWTNYLSKVSAEWKQKVGEGTAVNWPTGVGGKGNEGVAGLVKQTPGSIGYVELIYALQNKISYGSVQNAAGEFTRASAQSVTVAAAEAAAKMPPDFRVSITNAPGKGAYPISSFTWLLLYENPKDKPKAKAIVDFMKWALTDGQKYADDLGYAPLPEGVVKLEMAALMRIKTS